jgi:hypothetical protein
MGFAYGQATFADITTPAFYITTTTITVIAAITTIITITIAITIAIMAILTTQG